MINVVQFKLSKRMQCRSATLVMLALLAPATLRSESQALRFVKQIGVGWQAEKFGWMGFVVFNQDGAMVASEGPAAPGDLSGGLTLWSFPEWRLVKRLPARPTAISGDFKFLHGIPRRLGSR